MGDRLIGHRFKLPDENPECVGFAYSPLLEAVLSLHVLVEPKHHPLQHPWVREMRRLRPELKRPVTELSFVLVGISEAGLSKHLQLLARAGLVSSKREGYYVLYSLVPERIEPISGALLAYLRRSSANGSLA